MGMYDTINGEQVKCFPWAHYYEHEIVYTSALILATGGVGQLYKYTTNPEGATGDGIDLAYNAGAILQDMEFIQFHPTALALSPDNKDRFLISEAVLIKIDY